MPSHSVDVAIVGGGGVGSAIAYFLTLYDPALRVAVIERDPTYSQASTALSAGGIRQQFCVRENVLMSQFGFAFLRSAAETLAVNGHAPDVGLMERGYLFLASEKGRDRLRSNCAMQRAAGAATEWLEASDIARLYPWLACEGIAAGTVGRSGEGVFDPYALLQALRRKAIAQGAQYRHAEMAAVTLNGGAVEAIRLADGTRLDCGTLVNAAGPQAARVAAMVGVELPVIALKGETFVFRAEQPIADCPILIDPSGLHVRSEGDTFICTMPGPEEPADCSGDFDVDYAQFDDRIWPALAARVPQFSSLKLLRGWAGHLEFNLFDQNPVLGRHPDITNFIFANGFSGHGIQHAPATGRAIAELILWDQFRTLDLSRFGFARIAENAPLPEYHVD